MLPPGDLAHWKIANGKHLFVAFRGKQECSPVVFKKTIVGWLVSVIKAAYMRVGRTPLR